MSTIGIADGDDGGAISSAFSTSRGTRVGTVVIVAGEEVHGTGVASAVEVDPFASSDGPMVGLGVIPNAGALGGVYDGAEVGMSFGSEMDGVAAGAGVKRAGIGAGVNGAGVISNIVGSLAVFADGGGVTFVLRIVGAEVGVDVGNGGITKAHLVIPDGLARREVQ